MLELRVKIDGLHQIGGRKPDNVKYPENIFKANFQYIGFIAKSDPYFDWLPDDLHLICPIYLNIKQVFLDYVDPSSPRLISPTGLVDIDTEYDELSNGSYIEFETRKLVIGEVEEIDDLDCIGIINQPISEENQRVPLSPINGKPMRMVCQLMTFGEIPVATRNFESEEDNLQYLNFWGDGSLFIYFEPISRVACYFIENT